MAHPDHQLSGFLVDQRPVTAGQVQQQHADHGQQDKPAVSAAPGAWRALSLAASAGVRALTDASGGLRPAPGFARLLADIDAASSQRTPLATVAGQPRQLTTAQAAPVMGVSVRRVQQLAAEKRIIACKSGRDWLIDSQAAEEWRTRACRI